MATTYIEIASVTVGSGGASSIDFTSLPATYTDLKVSLSIRTNRAYAFDAVYFYFNNDTTSGNYTAKELLGNGSGASSVSYGYADEEMYVTGDSATANIFSNSEIYIPNYAGSTAKSVSIDTVSENNATTAAASIAALLWSGTSAINQITFKPVTGTLIKEFSTAYIYGIKKD